MEEKREPEDEPGNIIQNYELLTAGILGTALTLFLIYFVESYILNNSPNILTLLYVGLGILIGLLIGRTILRNTEKHSLRIDK